uniref:Coatomer subunit delta n=1 Tax=Urocitellus parryii TaxID=9999 RepID=A0A8D2I7K9_UROPR
MVLLAAAVCTKLGKAIVSQQFVEMTQTWLEAGFPKLMNTGKQHMFVEMEKIKGKGCFLSIHPCTICQVVFLLKACLSYLCQY